MSDARKDNNPRLAKSLKAVDDSFEELADLAPTVYYFHPPPTVSLSCPSGNLETGSQIILTAVATMAFDARKQTFFWTLSEGKIVSGQGTPTLAIDTTGEAGKKILVRLDVDDGAGHVASTTCELKIGASEQP